MSYIHVCVNINALATRNNSKLISFFLSDDETWTSATTAIASSVSPTIEDQFRLDPGMNDLNLPMSEDVMNMNMKVIDVYNINDSSDLHEDALSDIESVSSEENKTSRPPRWHEVYDNIPVDVSAEWDAFELSLRDLSNLNVDDVIEMDPSLITQTKLRIENRTCFTGEIGLEGDQVAFQVNESITDALKMIGKNHG